MPCTVDGPMTPREKERERLCLQEEVEGEIGINQQNDAPKKSDLEKLKGCNLDLENLVYKLRRRIDTETQNLCYLIGNIKEADRFDLLDTERLIEWSKDHDMNDTNRVTEKMIDYINEHPACDYPIIAGVFIGQAEVEHPVSRYHKEWFIQLAKKLKIKENK